MRKTRMADATEFSVSGFKTSPMRRGQNKKRLEITYSYPTDWRASRLRRALIEQAKAEDVLNEDDTPIGNLA